MSRLAKAGYRPERRLATPLERGLLALLPWLMWRGHAGDSQGASSVCLGHQVVLHLLHLVHNAIHVGKVCLVAYVALHLQV